MTTRKSGDFMFFEERVAWIITFIRKEKKLNNAQLGQILGVNKNTIQAYSKGKGDLKGVALAGIVKHFEINGEWLISGHGEPFPGAREKYPEVCGKEEQVLEPSENDIANGFVLIRQVNGSISAGGGLLPDNSVDIQCAFRREWIRKRGGSPDNMSLIKVSGDSMEPTLLSGDLVLVDHSRISVSVPGGIYAISIDHEIMIKRIQVLFHEGKLKIISDNRQYEPMDIEAEKVRINGKVIWYAREVEK